MFAASKDGGSYYIICPWRRILSTILSVNFDVITSAGSVEACIVADDEVVSVVKMCIVNVLIAHSVFIVFAGDFLSMMTQWYALS